MGKDKDTALEDSMSFTQRKDKSTVLSEMAKKKGHYAISDTDQRKVSRFFQKYFTSQCNIDIKTSKVA